MNFKQLCTPAKLYFGIAVFSALLMLFNRVHIITVVVKLIFAFLWTCVLCFLCKKGYKSVSWFLVLLPFIMMIFMRQNSYESELLESMTTNTKKQQPKK
jgi:hypothetical protein